MQLTIYKEALESMDIENNNERMETNYVVARNTLEKIKELR